MKKEVKNKAASVRAKLMNIARAEGIDFDALLLRYFQERFLYRLSISKFSNHFVLKGGLLFICFKMPMSRPTKDIDFLAEQVKNNPDDIKHIFRDIAKITYDDGIKFNSSSITTARIKEDADYEGIRLKIEATLGQAIKRLQMDIGFGDIIIPKAKVRVYSIESIISEKFEAMVKLAMANSRMKDFYDVYSLSLSHNFQVDRLKKAIETTFQKRKTPIPDNPLVFRVEFYENKERQKQWTAFLRKLRLHDINQEFNEIMKRIINLLEPVVISIRGRTRIDKSWDNTTGSLKK